MKHHAVHTVVVHLGTNMGDRATNLSTAVAYIEKKMGTLLSKSSIYQTAAWGKTDQADFFNQAIVLETALSPFLFLRSLQDIENKLGRKRKERWGTRIIDLDLIFYDDIQIQTPNLEIPHPRMHLRNFVLIPLLEIIPFWKHPRNQQTIRELYAWCQDDLAVNIVKP